MKVYGFGLALQGIRNLRVSLKHGLTDAQGVPCFKICLCGLVSCNGQTLPQPFGQDFHRDYGICIGVCIGIMEKKMETTGIIGVILDM